MAIASCLALPKLLWEGRVSERSGTSECVIPVREVRVRRGPGEGLGGSALPVPFLLRAPEPRTLVRRLRFLNWSGVEAGWHPLLTFGAAGLRIRHGPELEGFSWTAALRAPRHGHGAEAVAGGRRRGLWGPRVRVHRGRRTESHLL